MLQHHDNERGQKKELSCAWQAREHLVLLFSLSFSFRKQKCSFVREKMTRIVFLKKEERRQWGISFLLLSFLSGFVPTILEVCRFVCPSFYPCEALKGRGGGGGLPSLSHAALGVTRTRTTSKYHHNLLTAREMIIMTRGFEERHEDRRRLRGEALFGELSGT